MIKANNNTRIISPQIQCIKHAYNRLQVCLDGGLKLNSGDN